MRAVYTDLHIHTSDNADIINEQYNSSLLVRKVKEFSNADSILLSLTDHNTINKKAYESLLCEDVDVLLGVELHIRNYENCKPYHCHVFFDVDRCEIINRIDAINSILNKLYPKKMVCNNDSIPTLETIVKSFEGLNFTMLPHGGQSHNTFDKSIPPGIRFDSVIERTIYYNQFDGFTSRNNKGVEITTEYFRRLGISSFVNLITCTDNYEPSKYPSSKSSNEEFVPTWMLSKPSFQGLRLALSEETRLFYQKERPTFSNNIIKSAYLNNSNCKIDVELTHGLNVIIGGSSSGKTLFMDSLYKKITGSPFDEEYEYKHFGVDELVVSNPADYTPHYINQNYIIKILDKGNRTGIESIDIIQNTFPGSIDLDIAVENNLKQLRTLLNELFLAANNIKSIQKKIRSIPSFPRLVSRKSFQKNYFESLLPNNGVKESIEISEHSFDSYKQCIEKLKSLSDSNPFIDITKELDIINEKIAEAYDKACLSEKVLQAIDDTKNNWDEILEEESSEERTNNELQSKLKTYFYDYFKYLRSFYSALTKLTSFSFEYETKEIMAGGHQLKIKNNFKLNQTEILNAFNSFRRQDSIIGSFEDITPESLFQEQFNQTFSTDYQNKIYEKLAEKNKKIYEIKTKDGKNFDNLSPGWKTAVLLDIILNYDHDNAPIFIDQPEDNLATNYINEGLVAAIKKAKNRRQILIISHNATIPMLADAQNIILCENKCGCIVIKSAAMEDRIDNKLIIDRIAEITDGGKSAVKKRVKKYDLKSYREE